MMVKFDKIAQKDAIFLLDHKIETEKNETKNIYMNRKKRRRKGNGKYYK